jgi:hypothetical protein
MWISVRRRVATFVVAAFALALVSCGGGGEGALAPTEVALDERFLVLHLTPSEGEIAWRLNQDGSVQVTPALAWRAEFVSPLSQPTTGSRNITVVLRLLNAAETGACFEASADVRSPQKGFAYKVSGGSYRLGSEAWRYCGDNFSIGAAEVSLRESRNGGSFQTVRFPCFLRASRTPLG